MPKRNVLWMLAVVAVAVGTAWFMKRTPQARRRREVRPDTMVAAYKQILKNHYPPVDPLELKRSAVEGMVKALDPQSVYIPYEKAHAFRKRMEGQYRGVGLILAVSDKGLVVDSVHSNSPAEQARLAGGDVISHINDRPAAGMSLQQASESLSADEDGEIRLRVIQGDRPDQIREVTLTPREYPVETVTGFYRASDARWTYAVDRDEGLAYIKISEFVEGTVDRFKKAFRKPSMMRGLVLDLRGNPGGYLPEAVALADLFLHDGLIVTVLGAGGSVETHKAHADGTYPDIPVVVLVDSGTASAAEIVAGAMSCGDRAVLLGAPTRGKHSVQTPLVLEGRLGLLHLTTARFFFGPDDPETATMPASETRPALSLKAIAPHVPTPLDPDGIRKLRTLRRRRDAAGLAPTTMPATRPAGELDAAFGRELLSCDNQLAAAIELLKAPQNIRQILNKSAEARRKRCETQPAGQRSEIER